MSVTHHINVKEAIATAVLTEIDEDAGAGALVIQTSADATLASLALADPAGTVSAAGVLTFDTTPALSATASGTGTATKFKITDNSGDEKLYGSVGTSGEDINLSSVSITSGDTVSISTLTYTAPV